MRYMYLYYDYIAKMDKLKTSFAEGQFALNTEESKKVLYAEQNIKKLYQIFIIATIFLALGMDFTYNILLSVNSASYSWIYLGVWALIYVGFLLFYIKYNRIKKAYSKQKDKYTIEEETKKIKMHEESEKLYAIIIQVICLNDYYDELINLDGSALTSKWLSITKDQLAAINKACNYDKNIEKYSEYFKCWLKNRENEF